MAENEIPISFKWYLNRQGIQGQQGERGEEGFSPTITVNENSLTAYTLKVQNKTESFVTPNLRQVVADSGGTYVRYDRTTGNLYAGNPDFATTTQSGMVRFCTEEELNDAYDGSVISPADLKEYIDNNLDIPIASSTTLGLVKVGENLTITSDGTLNATGGSSNLNNITDTDSGVAITDTDSGLIYPQTINIVTANTNENYSYIECKSSGSGLSSGIKFNSADITLMGGSLNNTNVGAAGFRLNFDKGAANPNMIIGEPVFLKGKNDVTSDGVTNLQALDYTHTIEESDTFKSGGFFIFDKQSSYNGTFTTKGILFTVGDEPSIKFTNSTSNNGVWTDNVNATVLTDKTGILYKALTEAEYTALGTKSENTIYRLTDTNKVYLGSIELTGGSGGLTPVDTAGLGLGAATGGYVGTTTVTVTNPDEEGT